MRAIANNAAVSRTRSHIRRQEAAPARVKPVRRLGLVVLGLVRGYAITHTHTHTHTRARTRHLRKRGVEFAIDGRAPTLELVSSGLRTHVRRHHASTHDTYHALVDQLLREDLQRRLRAIAITT
jgi:hypothetical protein